MLDPVLSSLVTGPGNSSSGNQNCSLLIVLAPTIKTYDKISLWSVVAGTYISIYWEDFQETVKDVKVCEWAWKHTSCISSEGSYPDLGLSVSKPKTRVGNMKMMSNSCHLVLFAVEFLCQVALEWMELWEKSRQLLGQEQRRFLFWVKLLFFYSNSSALDFEDYGGVTIHRTC